MRTKMYKTEMRLSIDTKTKLDDIQLALNQLPENSLGEVKISQADTIRYCINKVHAMLLQQ